MNQDPDQEPDGPPPSNPEADDKKGSRWRTEGEAAVAAYELDHHHLGEGEPEDADHITFHDAEREETEMDMTPMVDVTFLLLIFFMVTAAFTLQKKIDTPTPKPDEPSTKAEPQEQDESELITVIVDSQNTYRVLTADWEAEAPSEQELLIKIREAGQGDSSGRKPSRMLVKAHIDAMHKKVVTALDAGTEMGLELQLMKTEEDE